VLDVGLFSDGEECLVSDVGDRVKVESFVLDDVPYVRGDQIRVLPSVPRHRDGFVGKVLSATVEAGVVLFVDVFGAPGSKAPSTRSLSPDRLAALPKKSRGPKRGKHVDE
jgi:hypothetical protein